MTTEKFDPNKYKTQAQQFWNEFSEDFERFAVPYLKPYGYRLLELAEIKKGESVLDVATGTGEPAFGVASLVGESGKVVGTDLSEGMLQVARRKAKTKNLKNIEFVQMDAENLRFPDNSFDVVLSRFVLMLLADSKKCLSEIRRVLKVGGRLVLSTWSQKEKVPTFSINEEVFHKRLNLPEPPDGTPDFFRFGADNFLKSELLAAGFNPKNIYIEHTCPIMSFESEDEYWNFVTSSPATKKAVQALNDQEQKGLKQALKEVLKKYKVDGKIQIPQEAVIAKGIK